MTEDLPAFAKSEYFIEKPFWHISPDAPQEIKDEFEEYANNPSAQECWAEDYPDMKNPYCTWEGKLIDKE